MARAIVYQIRVDGELQPYWAEWFDGLSLRHEEGDTILVGPVPDQAALYGLLNKMRDLGLTLLSVEIVKEEPEG